MKRGLAMSIGIVAIIVIATLLSSLFTVSQAEQALVLRFGASRGVIKDPGLHMKVPFIEDVVRYDARVIDLDPPAEPIYLADQKRIVVDTFTRYRIEDPLRFYEAVRNEESARQRLREIVNATLRRVMGTVMLPAILSNERQTIMTEIQRQVQGEARNLGIQIVDVRLRRADLPEETSQAIFDRMKSEREREAREIRAQGQERALQIRSRADRERTVILAEAQSRAQIARGEGDEIANRVLGEAYGQNPQFFALYRSLQAYRTSLGDNNTSLVLSPDSEFFRYFDQKSAVGQQPRR
jgi:membrane protease subunit HflC